MGVHICIHYIQHVQTFFSWTVFVSAFYCYFTSSSSHVCALISLTHGILRTYYIRSIQTCLRIYSNDPVHHLVCNLEIIMNPKMTAVSISLHISKCALLHTCCSDRAMPNEIFLKMRKSDLRRLLGNVRSDLFWSSSLHAKTSIILHVRHSA